jgi:hypothetical protein
VSFDYAAAQADARAILADFGRIVTVWRPALAGADPADPDAGIIIETRAEVLAAVLPVSRGRVGMGVGETVIGQDDVTIYAAADIAFPPEANDIVETEVGTFRVLGVTALAPAGTVVVYEMTGRR